jgi:hypothetical protein
MLFQRDARNRCAKVLTAAVEITCEPAIDTAHVGGTERHVDSGNQIAVVTPYVGEMQAPQQRLL